MAAYSIRRNSNFATAVLVTKIYIHWLELTGLLSLTDLPDICHHLAIPGSLFKQFETRKGTNVLTYDTVTGSEAVYISIPREGHSRLTLRGSYFDNFPEQSLRGLLDLMFSRYGNCLRLDISLKDTAGHIDFVEYARMSGRNNYTDYCSGSSVTNRKKTFGEVPDSNNRGGVPDVHQNHTLIHFGNADSRSYAKLYVCLDGFSKFEVTLQNNKQTRVLLDTYDIDSMGVFNALSKAALVKCINFVTPASKKQKRLEQISSYAKFLGAPVKPIRWTAFTPAAEKLTKMAALVAVRDRVISQLWSCISRFDVPRADIEALTAEIEARLLPSVWEF